MVQTIQKFSNEITGRMYDTLDEAEFSEIKSLDIQKAFEFYDAVKSEHCNFENGKFCVQRNEEFYIKVLRTLLDMVNKHEHWITERYLKQKGSMSIEDVEGHKILSRYLGESNSELYKWWVIQLDICPVCYREYGQPYYALNCLHNDKIETR